MQFRSPALGGMKETSIWYIHPYAGGPGLGTHHRPYELCRAWNDMPGCRARVIMPSFHHCLTRAGLIELDFEVGAVPFHAVPSPEYSGNGVKRVLQMLHFTARLNVFGRGLLRRFPEARPDVVIASSPHPFCAWGAAQIARNTGAKFVFEIRDLWPLSLIELGEAPAWHPFVRLVSLAERAALRRADIVASVLPRADRYLAERGYQQKPFVWVPNGMKAQKAATSAGISEVTLEVVAKLKQWKAAGRLRLIYVGSMGSPNGVRRLTEALCSPRLAPLARRIGVMLVGSGPEGESLKSASIQSAVPIEWSRGSIPPADVASVLQYADFAYAGVQHRPNLYRYGVSFNKLPEYMAAGLPVLLPCDPCGDPVSQSGGGFAESAANADELASLIARMAMLPQSELRLMGERGRDFAATNYAYDQLARRYLEAIAA